MNTRILHVIALGSCLLAGCARSTDLPGTTGGPVDGRIIDQDTGQGIPNAFVLVRWMGGLGATSVGGSSSTLCIHAELGRTDANGNYRIPVWTSLPEERPRYVRAGNFRLFKAPWRTAYAPGYQLARPHHDEEPIQGLTRFVVTGKLRDPSWSRKRFSARFEERIIQDDWINQDAVRQCTHSKREVEKLKPLWEAMYEEESKLTLTPKEEERALERRFEPDIRADDLELSPQHNDAEGFRRQAARMAAAKRNKEGQK